MGFHLSNPNIGFCDFRSPVEFLRKPVLETGCIRDEVSEAAVVRIVGVEDEIGEKDAVM